MEAILALYREYGLDKTVKDALYERVGKTTAKVEELHRRYDLTYKNLHWEEYAYRISLNKYLGKEQLIPELRRKARLARQDFSYMLWNGIACPGKGWVHGARSCVTKRVTTEGSSYIVKVRKASDLRRFAWKETLYWTTYEDTTNTVGHGRVLYRDPQENFLAIQVQEGKPPEEGHILFHGNVGVFGLHGVTDWIPTGDPLRENWTGEIREWEPERRGLLYRGEQHKTITEAINHGLIHLMTYSDVTHPVLFMNSQDYGALESYYDSPYHRFLSIQPMPYVPEGYAWVLDPNSWIFTHNPISYGFPGLLQTPERGVVFSDNTVKIGWEATLLCTQLESNAVIHLPSRF